MAEVKAKGVSIDLKKKLKDVLEDQKKQKQKSKPKPTVPNIGNNLYPQNPKDISKTKIEKAIKSLAKIEDAAKLK